MSLSLKEKLQKIDSILSSPETAAAARGDNPGLFTRIRKIPLRTLLYYLIFRKGDVLADDINAFFPSVLSFDDKPTRYAMIKRMSELSNDVWTHIISRMTKEIYEPNETYRGYVLITVDGSPMDCPVSSATKEAFGGPLNRSVTRKEDLKRVMLRMSVLYDPLNHMAIDVSWGEYNTSEIPMMMEMLDRVAPILKNTKVIILADRYYPSAELFLLCKMRGWDYIVRAKKNFFKKQRAEHNGESDFTISVPITAGMKKRFKRDDVRDYAKDMDSLDVRVVASDYDYTEKKRGKYKWYEKDVQVHAEYFTSLNSDFAADEIRMLYHNDRWQVESTFFTLKTQLKLEQVNTHDPTAVVNEMLAKIVFFNIEKIFFHEAQKKLEKKERDRKRKHKVNNRSLITTLHNSFFVRAMYHGRMTAKMADDLIKNALSELVSVRPGRHYQRWRKFLLNIPNNRHRMDGRNDPCMKATKSGILTTNH